MNGMRAMMARACTLAKSTPKHKHTQTRIEVNVCAMYVANVSNVLCVFGRSGELSHALRSAHNKHRNLGGGGVKCLFFCLLSCAHPDRKKERQRHWRRRRWTHHDHTQMCIAHQNTHISKHKQNAAWNPANWTESSVRYANGILYCGADRNNHIFLLTCVDVCAVVVAFPVVFLGDSIGCFLMRKFDSKLVELQLGMFHIFRIVPHTHRSINGTKRPRTHHIASHHFGLNVSPNPSIWWAATYASVNCNKRSAFGRIKHGNIKCIGKQRSPGKVSNWIMFVATCACENLMHLPVDSYYRMCSVRILWMTQIELWTLLRANSKGPVTGFSPNGWMSFANKLFTWWKSTRMGFCPIEIVRMRFVVVVPSGKFAYQNVDPDKLDHQTTLNKINKIGQTNMGTCIHYIQEVSVFYLWKKNCAGECRLGFSQLISKNNVFPIFLKMLL